MSTDRPALENPARPDGPRPARVRRADADGEGRVGRRLASVEGVITLHDRGVPGSRAVLDHVAVAPSGVFVVDARHYHRTDVSVRRTGGIFGPVQEQLMVGGRDTTSLVDEVRWQRDAVRAAVDPDVTVTAVLCFVDAHLPLLTRLAVGDVRVVGLRGLGKLVAAAGPLDAEAREALVRRLAVALPVMP